MSGRKGKGAGARVAVLVVDDEATSRDVLRTMLEEGGHRVDTAASGAEAARALQGRDYPVVVTDMVMPDMNGVELVRVARRLRPGAEILVISGEATRASEEKLRSLGVRVVLRKPVPLDRLLREVAKAAGRITKPAVRSVVSKRSVLIVDDNDDFVTSMAMGLRLHGYEVAEARDGLQGLRQVRASGFDAIVADINMPRMDGIDLVRQIRKIYPTTFLLMVSGEAENSEVREALHAGATGFLGKPVGVDRLVATLERGWAENLRTREWVSQDRRIGVRAVKRLFGAQLLARARALPIATMVILGLLALAILYAVLTPARTQNSFDSKIDRLIEAVEKDWGR